jgi:protein TonB
VSAAATPAPEIRTIAEPAPPIEIREEPLVTMPLVEAADFVTALDQELPILEEDQSTNLWKFGWLQVVRTSPWPVMALVGVMALVTVSALGLRSGSSSATVLEPPAVASPPTSQPDGYAAQLPAAPLAVDESVTPSNTALGESPWKPAGPSARGLIAASAPTTAPVTSPVPTRPAAVSTPPLTSSPAAASPEAPAAGSVPPIRVDEPVVDPRREAVTVLSPPASPPEPKNETPAPPPAPPAVSSARPSAPGAAASEPVPELPRPAARTAVPVIAARRLTGAMPEYSRELRQQKVGGVVAVRMRIDLNGRVVSAMAVSGPPPLRQLAEAAVRKWRYAPATRNGIPIETESQVTFSFDPSQNRRQ